MSNNTKTLNVESLTDRVNNLIAQNKLDTTIQEMLTEIVTQLAHPDTQIIFTAEQRQLMSQELNLWLTELETN